MTEEEVGGRTTSSYTTAFLVWTVGAMECIHNGASSQQC
ncbi:hypothetical protein GBAR_LOCUS5097, partial [Geodia barretti]